MSALCLGGFVIYRKGWGGCLWEVRWRFEMSHLSVTLEVPITAIYGFHFPHSLRHFAIFAALTKGQIGSDTMLMLKVVMLGSCRWSSRFVGLNMRGNFPAVSGFDQMGSCFSLSRLGSRRLEINLLANIAV